MNLRLTTLTLCLLALAQANFFASNLFSSLTVQDTSENIAVCPALIRASLALIYVGADGQTALELKKWLQLHGNDKDDALVEFLKMPNLIHRSEMHMLMVYKLYVDGNFKIKPSFKHKATKILRGRAGNENFNNAKLLARVINAYFAAHTHLKVMDAVSEAETSSLSTSLLMQAFYFSGAFAEPFYRYKDIRPFNYDGYNSVYATTYVRDGTVLFGVIPELFSSVVELPYKKSNMSLLIILPIHPIFDLEVQQEELKNFDLRHISNNFQSVKARVQLPNFKIEYETDLTDALSVLGINSIFTENDFSGLTDKTGFRLSDIKHKGVIEVNEEKHDCKLCTEPDASASDIQHYFIADRPFLFAIKDPSTVYFVGRVMKPKLIL